MADGFDPDAYLAKAPDSFDPDAYLKKGADDGAKEHAPSFGDELTKVGKGLVKGASYLSGMQGDVREAADYGARKIVGAFGGDPALIPSMRVRDIAPHLGLDLQTIPAHYLDMDLRSIFNPSSADIQKTIEPLTGALSGPDYRAQSRIGKLAQTAAEFVPAGMAGGAGTLRGITRGALNAGVLPGVGSEAAGQLTEGTQAEPYARVAGALASPAAVAAARNVFSPARNVASDLGRALVRDKDTPEEFLRRAAEAQSVRPGVAIPADVGGENVQGLLERIAQTPGAGRTIVTPALTGRQKGQMTRIAGDLAELTGNRRTAIEAAQQTMAERAKASTPLYDEAMNFDARSVPDIMAAWKNETGTGWGRQILNSADFKNTLQTEHGIADATSAPLMKVIDAWKKEADGLVGESVRAGNNNRARVIGDMRDRLVQTVDDFNPAYAKARNAWAGPSQYLDAINDGKSILSPKTSAQELQATFPAMTDANKEGYRIGAISAIVGKMGGDPSKMGDMTKYLRSPEMRAKVAAIMPTPEAADTWAKRLSFEVASSELSGRALGNSATARRLAERKDADGLAAGLALDAFMGSPPVSLFQKLIGSIPQRVRDTLRSKSDNILANALTDPAMANLESVTRMVASGRNAPTLTRDASPALAASVPQIGRRDTPPFARGGGVASSNVPHGARLAPDGHHYVPDPGRPGKYLKVVPRKREAAA